MRLLKSLLACAAVTAAAAALPWSHDQDALPYYRSAAMDPEWLPARTASSPSMHRVAAFQMVDQHDDTVSEHAFDGKATLVQFFFTKCADICPMTTANLAHILKELGDDARVQLLSYSIAPDSDSISALKAFATNRGIVDPRWHLLTGSRPDVERMARESFFARLGDGTTYGVSTIEHTESVFLVDSNGRVRGVYAGTLALEGQRMQEDVLTLLKSY